MTVRCPTEHEEAVALATILDAAGLFYCHVPNEGKRRRGAAGRLKAEGLKAGMPDYLIFDRPENGRYGVALELKRRVGSRPTKAQLAVLERFRIHRWTTIVAFGCDDAITQLKPLYPHALRRFGEE